MNFGPRSGVGPPSRRVGPRSRKVRSQPRGGRAGVRLAAPRAPAGHRVPLTCPRARAPLAGVSEAQRARRPEELKPGVPDSHQLSSGRRDVEPWDKASWCMMDKVCAHSPIMRLHVTLSMQAHRMSGHRCVLLQKPGLRHNALLLVFYRTRIRISRILLNL